MLLKQNRAFLVREVIASGEIVSAVSTRCKCNHVRHSCFYA